MPGPSGPAVGRIRALRRDAARRDEEGVLLAEGLHLADEALAAEVSIESAWVSPELSLSPEGRALRERLEARASEFLEVGAALLDSLQDARAPQPVLLVVRFRPASIESALRGRGGVPLVAVAVGVQDPGNLGAIVRTADAAGATGFVATGRGADLLHPRAVRATMGSIFRIPVARAGTREIPEALRAAAIRGVGTAPRAPVDHEGVDWTRPTALFLGGEGAGLPEEIRDSLDALVSIPMHPGVESLSVGAAAAVLLFAARRARRLSSAG